MAQNEIGLSGVVNASGEATLTMRTTGGARWTVQQVSPDAPNVGSAAGGELRKNGQLISPFVPQGDAIAGDPSILVGPNDRLTVEWTGGTVGAQVSALFIYDDGIRT